MQSKKGLVWIAMMVGLLVGVPSSVRCMTISLGDQDFVDGSFIATTADFMAPQSGEPALMGQFIGGDLLTTSFNTTWTFNYAPGTYSSASITFGIWEHDSAASGNQLLSFMVDGIDLTGALNPLFEAPGVGTQVEYNVFNLGLTGAALAALADGSATFALSLQGPALCGFEGTTNDCGTENGAALDFSTLTIREPSSFLTVTVPEPGSLLLVVSGLLGLGVMRRRATRKS